jgi:hypothetical protein
MKPVVREVMPHHVADLAENLRAPDRRELEGLTSAPAFSALAFSVKHSRFSRVVLLDERVVAIFGVADLGGCAGSVWCLCTDLIEEVAVQFARQSRYWIREMRGAGKYKSLRNVVDMRNDRHVKWLKWCGAKLYGGPIKKHYRRFEIKF